MAESWGGVGAGLKTYGLQSHSKYRGLTVQFSLRFMLSLVLMSLRRTQCAPLVWALLFALGAGPAMGAEDVAGTLPEDYVPALKPLLALALKQSPQVIAKEIDISRREAQVLGADAQRLPNVSGHLDYLRDRTAISGVSGSNSSEGGFFYGAAVNLPLFHWYALENQSEAARIEVAIADKNYAEAYRLLTVELRQRYLALIVRKAYLRQARYAFAMTEFDLNVAKDNLARGQLAKEVLAAQQVSCEEASVGLERAEAQFASLRRAFARLVGLDDLAEDAIPLEIPPPAYSANAVAELLAGLLREGGRGTYQAQIHEMEMHEADLNYKIAQVRLLPKFNAVADYSLENTTVGTATAVSQQGLARETVAVNAQWTIFDGFAARGAKAEALANKRQHERELKNTTEQTLDRAQWLQRELALDARELALKETHEKLVADNLSRAQEELGRGKASKRTIESATSDLYFHQADTTVARANLLTFWSELVSLAGADPILNNLPAHHVREKR